MRTDSTIMLAPSLYLCLREYRINNGVTYFSSARHSSVVV